MNNDRRKRIRNIADALEKIMQGLPDIVLDDTVSEIAGLKDEEQEYYDNIPESLQNGDKGSRAQEAVDFLQEAEDALQEFVDAFDKLEDIVGNLRNAENV